MSIASRTLLCAALVVGSAASPLRGAAQRIPSDRYDSYFKKYAKRYFGVGFDWKLFKAQ